MTKTLVPSAETAESYISSSHVTVPALSAPQGNQLGSEVKISNQDKYYLVCRSAVYLELKRSLGENALPKKNLTRHRVSPADLPKLPLDKATAAVLDDCQETVTSEARLWIERLNEFAASNRETKVKTLQQLEPLCQGQDERELCFPPPLPTPAIQPSDVLTVPLCFPPPLPTPAIQPSDMPERGVSTDTAESAEEITSEAKSPVDPLLFLLSTVLSAYNIHAFNDQLVRLYDTRPAFLRAQTVEKAFVVLRAAVKAVCGGPSLSKVSALTRQVALDSCRALADAEHGWHKKSTVDVNQTESHRLKRALREIRPHNTLLALYFLVLCERYWFLALLDAGEKAISNELKQATAFVYLTVVLGRALTRAGVMIASQKIQTEQDQEPTGNLTMFFEQHKTARC